MLQELRYLKKTKKFTKILHELFSLTPPPSPCSFLIAINSVIKFDMPGVNCAIPRCSTSRATTGVAFLGIPKDNDEYNVNWRKNIVDMITKIRVVDASLKRKIERSLHLCEEHYPEEKLIRCKYKIMTTL